MYFYGGVVGVLDTKIYNFLESYIPARCLEVMCAGVHGCRYGYFYFILIFDGS